MADLAHPQLDRRHGHDLIGDGGAIIDAEGPVEQQRVEAEETEYRPGAHHQEKHARHETDAGDRAHQNRKTELAERAVRRDHRLEDRLDLIVCTHAASIALFMAKITRKPASKKKPRARVKG